MMEKEAEKETVNSRKHYLLSALSFTKYFYKLVRWIGLANKVSRVHCEPGAASS